MKMPADIISSEIRDCGAISFARFMELALYCPKTGYYERNQDIVGRTGDFITSVSTGSLFGELLAWQFAEWLTAPGFRPPAPGNRLTLVETGAHDGKLAADILGWLQAHRPELLNRLEYVIVEPSASRRPWQQDRLKSFAQTRWVDSLTELAPPHVGIHGILFSNELLDAFPVRRLGWSAPEKTWFEHGVTLQANQFVWCRLPHPVPAPAGCPPELEAVLPDQYIIECSPSAEAWWQTAAGCLCQGKLLAIDYGFTTWEQFSPARTQGTLRAYQKHQVNRDLLAAPGSQDLTAHVNFSAIQKAGEQAGLQTDWYGTQPQWLTRILGDSLRQSGQTTLDPKQIRQFQTLTHPDHLGRAFKVLIQSRP